MSILAYILLYVLVIVVEIAQCQQIAGPEIHPPLVTRTCNVQAGCVTDSGTSIVLDEIWRDLTDIETGNSCLSDSGKLNKMICSCVEECARRCALNGADYHATGVVVKDDSVTLHMFRDGELVSPQVYLFSEIDSTYQMLKLINREISFEVDISNLPCGLNGAMYLAEMTPDGGKGPLNGAGAAYGTGYCDSQCYTSYNFVNGVANIDYDLGTCCNEMDLWEANSMATQITPHPCNENVTSFYACEGRECGDGKAGVCDKVGCGYNPYSLGAHRFYGWRKRIVTQKPFRVVTQFLTSDDTDQGTLIEIRRLYIQNGKVIDNAKITFEKDDYDSITSDFCDATALGSFDTQYGGLKTMGEALRRGMVLVMGVWNDASGWLDSGEAGPCHRGDGRLRKLQDQFPDAKITFGDIRWGEVGSTSQ